MRHHTCTQFSYEKQVLKQLSNHQSRGLDEIDFDDYNVEFEPSFVLSQPKTIFRELNTLIYRQREKYVTYDEFFQFLYKLKITDAPEQALSFFRMLDFDSDNLVQLQDLNATLNQDLCRMNLLETNQAELILKISLEIFYHMSGDSYELDLKQSMNYIKSQLNEDIDFLETLDMFGFVQDIYTGQIVTKISLQSYFQKVAPQLRQALSPIILRKLQFIIGEKQKVQLHNRHTNSISHVQNFAKKHQRSRLPLEKSCSSSPFYTQNNESIKSDIERLLQKNFNIKMEVEVQDEKQKQQHNDSEQDNIANLIKENRPKVRGWLQRLSLKKQDKWSLLFFQIDQQTRLLRAIKPESIKKVCQISQCELQVVSDWLVISEGKRGMIVRCQELSEILGLLIDFQELLSKKQQFPDEQYTYSGIVSMSFVCVEKDVDKYESKMKSYSFKDYLMVIKDGKIIFYLAQVKHSLSLQQITMNPIQQGLPFVPSHPFSFQLILKEEEVKPYIKVQQRVQEQPYMEDQVQQEGSVIMWQIDEDEREYSEHESKQEKVEDKKGFFDSILDKFKKKADKKEVRLTLSAESEPKRRQWIFSLNYYKSSDSSKSNKSSVYGNIFNQTPIPSQYCQTPMKSSFLKSSVHNTQNQPQKTINRSNNSQIYVGGNHMHINMNFYNLGSDDDYYDVYKDDGAPQRNRNQNQQQFQSTFQRKSDQHCHTDPNEQHVQQDERLVTLPSKEKRHQRLQIYSTSTVDLWQRFLISFFKLLIRRRLNLRLEEEQEPKIQPLYSRRLNVCKPK